MLPRLTLILLLLLPGVCEGFDFTFQKLSSASRDVATISGECGVMTCIETIADGTVDTRKIKSLTVYRRKSVNVSSLSHWEQLANVTPQSPTENIVSDAKHIVGKLTDTSARIEVRLKKSNDCASLKLACISRLSDDNRQISTMKSVIGGKGGISDDSDLEPEENGQHEITSKVETIMAALEEKLKCIEDRLTETSRRDERLEDKLEALNEKINTVSRDIDISGDRIEDKMDLMKDRLEDKLSELRDGKSLHLVESNCMIEVCVNVSSQLELVGNSQDVLGKNMRSLSDQVREVQNTMPTTSVLDNKLERIESVVSGMTAATNNLTAEVGVLGHSCAEKSPATVAEFFDVFGNGRKEWRLAFRGRAHNNVEIYPAYLYGTGIPADVEVGCKQFNRSKACANHYRNNDALDNWVNVDEVLLALYVKGQMVQHITFNGRGSSWINWFHGNRVIESSWTDLKTKKHNMFTIEGDSRSHLLRRFYVSHIHNGCPGDFGWFVAGDALPGGCPWESKLARPAFIYAKGNTVSRWEDRHNVGRADAMGIFIKYQ